VISRIEALARRLLNVAPATRSQEKIMDLQSRFAIFTAVGVASFSAGLSLTTACSTRVEPEPEKITIHPSLPTEPARPVTPVREAAAQRPSDTAPPKPVFKPPADEKALASDKVAVRRLVVTHAVKDREPIEPAELVTGTPVLAFIEVSNADAIERNVVITFEREGRPAVGHVKLHVPGSSPRYRTWARTHNLSEIGTWEAVVRSEDGKELGRQPFELLAMLDPA
jgi:hypothetical protein